MRLFKSIVLIPIWLLYSLPFIFLLVLFFPIYFIIIYFILKYIFVLSERNKAREEIIEWILMVTLPFYIPILAFIHYYKTETFLEI